MSALEIRFRHLPPGLIDERMQCGRWRLCCVLQADAQHLHGTLNDIWTLKPARLRKNPGATGQRVRRKFCLHGPGKLTVSAVAAIDAGDIKILCFADNTRGKRRQDGIISVCRPLHTQGEMKIVWLALHVRLFIGTRRQSTTFIFDVRRD
ncbi:hypothetical protein KPC190_01795 [Klebsiella pneumoniae]|nr:hypothetical protein [Klebsiella pneumoniae]